MREDLIYSVMTGIGCEILEFTDNPNFFGSWELKLKYKNNFYQIVSEGRDSYIQFFQKTSANKWDELYVEYTVGMSENDLAKLCEKILLAQ